MELKEKIKKLESELEEVKGARDYLVGYSQRLFNKLLKLEDELDEKDELKKENKLLRKKLAKIQSIAK